MSEDIQFLVLCPYEGFWQLFEAATIPGTVVARCNCGHLGLLSPSSAVFLRCEAAYVVCTRCALAAYDPPDDPQLRKTVPGAVGEAKARLPAGSAAVIDAFLRRNKIQNTDL